MDRHSAVFLVISFFDSFLIIHAVILLVINKQFWIDANGEAGFWVQML